MFLAPISKKSAQPSCMVWSRGIQLHHQVNAAPTYRGESLRRRAAPANGESTRKGAGEPTPAVANKANLATRVGYGRATRKCAPRTGPPSEGEERRSDALSTKWTTVFESLD